MRLSRSLSSPSSAGSVSMVSSVTGPVCGSEVIFPPGGGSCHDRRMTSSTSSFRAARDLLLRYRDDYDAALGSFSWPALDEFNWALDWFDVIAAEHPDRPALRILSDDDSDVSLSYGPLSEVILATMKLGAVIIPASTLLQPADLADRVTRGQVRVVITDAAGVPKFSAVPGDWTRIVVDGEAAASAE